MRNSPSTCSYSMKQDTSKLYWKLLGIDSGKVLDVGSGMGGFALAKPTNVELYGIERDLSIAKQSNGYTNISNIDIDAKQFPFEKNMFNGVLARDILEHIPEPWLVVDNIYDVMQEGGRFICSVPKPDPKIVWSDYTHIRGFTKGALISLVENSGFIVDDVFLMSGYTIAAKLGLSNYLPLLGKTPFIRSFMCSYHCIAHK